jgi:restriction system protein
MRDFLGALVNAGIKKGIFITFCGYTEYAKQFAETNGIELMNVTGLAKLLESTNARLDPEVLEILHDKRKFCPKCGAEMKLRVARKGPNPGQQFWGCSNYGPRGCQGRLPYQPPLQPTVPVVI